MTSGLQTGPRALRYGLYPDHLIYNETPGVPQSLRRDAAGELCGIWRRLPLTLCVARVFADRIRFYADSTIVDKNATTPNIIPGRLKILPIQPHVCVAYAGNAARGIDTIRSVAKPDGGPLPVESIENRLRDSSRSGEVDFLESGF